MLDQSALTYRYPAHAVSKRTDRHGIGLGRLLLILTVLMGSGFANAESPAAPETVAQDETLPEFGQRLVRLLPGGTERVGLGIETLTLVQQAVEVQGIAEVLDLQPLLDLRSEYRAAQADQHIADAALQASTREYERVRSLYREGAATSRRQAQEAEARLSIDRARRDSALQKQRSLRERGGQQWGQAVLELALAVDSPQFMLLLDRRAVMLLVSFDAQAQLPRPLPNLVLGRDPARTDAQAALAIWPAPVTSAIAQGESYFALGPAGTLRTGMRISAWSPTAAKAMTGVQINTDAIVWQAGEPWVYVEQEPDAFQRRAVHKHIDAPSGWLVSEGFKPGERIVVHGGQLLLSEEQRQQFPDE
jgi:hypothetical protein